MSRVGRRGVAAALVHALRQLKLVLFVAKKRAGWRWHMAWVRPADPVWRLYQRIRPFAYDADRYQGTFLRHTSDAPVDLSTDVPRRIFVVWTGANDLTPNRQRGLASIRHHNPDLEVVLVTDHNVDDWIVPGHPLHPSYEHLSLNHRSDHLRAYLLHHHGGGYCDVKSIRGPWSSAYDRLDASDAWLVGYTELRFDMVARIEGSLGRDLIRASTQVLGCGSFISRPRTPFTDELLSEQYRRLDEWADALAAVPGGERGQVEGYPVPWLGLMGSIVGPLCLKYQHRLLHDETIKVVFEDYR
jgi:hypothetical protein